MRLSLYPTELPGINFLKEINLLCYTSMMRDVTDHYIATSTFLIMLYQFFIVLSDTNYFNHFYWAV